MWQIKEGKKMKKLLFAISLLILFGAGQFVNVDDAYALYGLRHYQIELKDQRGLDGETVVTQPTITVYQVNTTTYQVIYADESGGCKNATYTLPTDGGIDFWTRATTVDIMVTDGDTSYYQMTFEDVSPTIHQLIVPVEETSPISLTHTVGSNVASASILTLGTGTIFRLTGTTTVNYISADDTWAGRHLYLIIGDSITITNGAGATTATRVPIMLAGNAGNWGATVGQVLELICDGCVWYQIGEEE